MDSRPIGTFDSGIGGLTVVKEITKLLPNESIIYLGDTARVPYGTRGQETITEYAMQLAKFLLTHNVKYLVVACNTISATCLNQIQEISPVPVLGVIIPSSEKIVQTTKNKKVGIIGTRATINSRVYEKELVKLDPDVVIFTKACPLFVPIAEEGLAHSDIAKLTAKEYLSYFQDKDIDTLHLGCTHYPILRDDIKEVLGKDIMIVDAAQPTAEKLGKLLEDDNLLNDGNNVQRTFYVTDDPEKVFNVAKIFFGENIDKGIRHIDLNHLQNGLHS